MAAALASRMLWPAATVFNQIQTVNGHQYRTGPFVFDALAADVAGLQAAGALLICQSGRFQP
jgi:hypothetical protein